MPAHQVTANGADVLVKVVALFLQSQQIFPFLDVLVAQLQAVARRSTATNYHVKVACRQIGLHIVQVPCLGGLASLRYDALSIRGLSNETDQQLSLPLPVHRYIGKMQL